MNIEILEKIYAGLYYRKIYDCYGETIEEHLDALVSFLNKLNNIVDIEKVKGGKIIVLTKITQSPQHSFLEKNSINISTIENIADEIREGWNIIDISDTRIVKLKREQLEINEEVYNNYLVYEYNNASSQEGYYLKDKFLKLDNPSPNCPSIYSRPTYMELRTAIDNYKRKRAKYGECSLLKDIWTCDKKIILINKPETKIRDSLHEFLGAFLRDAEVTIEHNTDESNPVDIRVRFGLEKKNAIIEIKWLGDSIHENGKSISTEYRDQRARDGAKQLFDYMQNTIASLPDSSLRGYLVVYDGRRKNTKKFLRDNEIDDSDALFYRDVEIAYDPRYHESYFEFEEPIRMYAEPKRCS